MSNFQQDIKVHTIFIVKVLLNTALWYSIYLTKSYTVKVKIMAKRTDSHHTWYLILIKSYWVFIEPNREGKNVIIKGVCLLFLHTCKINPTLGIVVLAKTWKSLFLYFKAYQVQAV